VTTTAEREADENRDGEAPVAETATVTDEADVDETAGVELERTLSLSGGPAIGVGMMIGAGILPTASPRPPWGRCWSSARPRRPPKTRRRSGVSSSTVRAAVAVSWRSRGSLAFSPRPPNRG